MLNSARIRKRLRVDFTFAGSATRSLHSTLESFAIMEIALQLSIFLNNEPGTLAEMTMIFAN